MGPVRNRGEPVVSEKAKMHVGSICPKILLDWAVQVYRFLWTVSQRSYWRLWDLWHGVETCKFEEISQQTVVGSNLAHGNRYEPSGFIRETLEELRIDYQRFGFIDLGSGKGRVLLKASEFPFRMVEGVEYSPELHRIAESNIRKFRLAKVRCRNVRSVLFDATEYSLPLIPLVVFLFNPFSGPVLTQAIHNIERSARQHPREILIVCCGTCMSRDDVERIPGIQTCWNRRYSGAYRLASG